MDNCNFNKITYWILSSVLIALLLKNSINNFWDAWLIALFLMPVVLFVKFGVEQNKKLQGIKKWLRYFFIAVVSLYWGYLAVTLAYWYFLELNSQYLDKILINPVFIWMMIGFFILLEYILFKKENKTFSDGVTIYSNRKKTYLKIDQLAYVESRSDFTIAVLIDGSKYRNAIKITEWENRLPNFLRIHRAFLVNPELTTVNGNEVVVKGVWTLPISRSYKPNVVGYFNKK